MILNRGEKNALRRFSRDKRDYHAVSKWKGIGLPSMRSLSAKGLVAEGPSGVFGPTFKLTTLGLAWRERLVAGERRGAASDHSVEVLADRPKSREPVPA